MDPLIEMRRLTWKKIYGEIKRKLWLTIKKKVFLGMQWKGSQTNQQTNQRLIDRPCLNQRCKSDGFLYRFRSSTFASARLLLLPLKCSYFISSYPTHQCGSGQTGWPLPLPHPWFEPIDRQTVGPVNPPIEMRKFFLKEVVRGKQKKTNSIKSVLSLRLWKMQFYGLIPSLWSIGTVSIEFLMFFRIDLALALVLF